MVYFLGITIYQIKELSRFYYFRTIGILKSFKCIRLRLFTSNKVVRMMKLNENTIFNSTMQDFLGNNISHLKKEEEGTAGGNAIDNAFDKYIKQKVNQGMKKQLTKRNSKDEFNIP